MVMQFYEWELLTVSYLSAKFGRRKHSGGGDLMLLICHMNSHNKVFKGLCHFIGSSSFR